MIKYSIIILCSVLIIAFCSCYKKAQTFSKEVIDENTLINGWVTSVLNKEVLIRNNSSGLYVSSGKREIQGGNKQLLEFAKSTFKLSDTLANMINLPKSGFWNVSDKNYIKEICLDTSINDLNCKRKLGVIGYYYDENLLQPIMLKFSRDIFYQDSIISYELIMEPAK